MTFTVPLFSIIPIYTQLAALNLLPSLNVKKGLGSVSCMPSGGVAMHSLDLFFHCEMVNLAFKKRFEDFLFLNRIIAYYFSIFANQNLYTRYEEEIMYFDKVSLCSNTFFILLPILIMTSTFNQSGGVVKVEIYEVDTKIALKVNTF